MLTHREKTRKRKRKKEKEKKKRTSLYFVSSNCVTKIYLATEIENEIKAAASCC